MHYILGLRKHLYSILNDPLSDRRWLVVKWQVLFGILKGAWWMRSMHGKSWDWDLHVRTMASIGTAHGPRGYHLSEK
jgi:hypothetical protein